jgi:hypothetical protein
MKNNLSTLSKSLILLFILVLLGAKLEASTTKQLDKKKWETLTKDLNYQDDTKKEIVKKNGQAVKPNIKLPTFKIQSAGQIILIIIVVLLLIFISKLIIQTKPNPTFENLHEAIENAEEKLLVSDIEMLLINAKKAGDWRLAIRIYYLIGLKTLHQFNYINWRKEKTNLQYNNELKGWVLVADWNNITRYYERTWYGENLVTESDFLSHENKIVAILKSISTTPTNE